jgi:hypothetical protein
MLFADTHRLQNLHNLQKGVFRASDVAFEGFAGY